MGAGRRSQTQRQYGDELHRSLDALLQECRPGAPPANAKAAAAWLQDFTTPTGLSVEQLQQVTQGALQHGHESYNHLLVGYDAITKAENDALANVWSGKLSPHDGLLQAKQQVDAVLQTIQ